MDGPRSVRGGDRDHDRSLIPIVVVFLTNLKIVHVVMAAAIGHFAPTAQSIGKLLDCGRGR